MEKHHQIHVDIKEETFKELCKLLPEQRMVSLLVRKLILNYIAEVKEGANPWAFLEGRRG